MKPYDVIFILTDDQRYKTIRALNSNSSPAPTWLDSCF